MTAVDIVWALTLEAFLSQPEKQNRYRVPELPHSSTEVSQLRSALLVSAQTSGPSTGPSSADIDNLTRKRREPVEARQKLFC